MRGALLAGSSAALAVSAHALANGSVPDAPLTLLLTVLIGWTASALAAKTTGILATMAALGAGQLVMHLVLSTLMVHTAPHTGGAVSGSAMAATHTGATIVTALLLARAEAMLRAAANAMRLLLPKISRTVPVPTATAQPTLALPADAERLVNVLFGRVHGKRGPPSYS
jgi:uncharacterized membrane protein YeaQ/YmgE (transglycosylase-associated protein family)